MIEYVFSNGRLTIRHDAALKSGRWQPHALKPAFMVLEPLHQRHHPAIRQTTSQRRVKMVNRKTVDQAGNHSDLPLRVAIYARFSSELQNEISIEDQVARCREEVARRGWRVAGIYTDSARSGWSLDRDGFQELRTAAEHGKFDAIMFWKFDRLARDHNHIVMIKALLRHQCGLKLFCVEGVSQDDDSPYDALVEQMIAVFAAFYSHNLSSDTRRAKHARALRGEFNGSVPPLGYILVTRAQAAPERPAGLHVDSEIAPIVVEAFERYATGAYSDRTIAEWLNEQPAIRRFCESRKPIGKEMVHDLLQNQTYTGRVGYSETVYAGASLGQRRKSRRNHIEWYEGRHEAILSDELFEACQAVRERLACTHKTTSQSHTYILPDRVFCGHCIARGDGNLADPNYDKMRIQWQDPKNAAIYRCIARDRGYGDCEQSIVYEERVLGMIVEMISRLNVPCDARERIDALVRSRPSNQQALEQLAELEEQQRRVQFSWEHGRLLPEEYLARTSQLEREIASMRPLDYDRLEEAADLITHFRSYWEQCAEVDNPEETWQQLMAKIVDRGFVYDDRVIAVALHPGFGIILDMPESAPNEVLTAVSESTERTRKASQSSVPNTEATGIDCSLAA
jgi:DNA invertase Pin-like site-specific DNA recombinase